MLSYQIKRRRGVAYRVQRIEKNHQMQIHQRSRQAECRVPLADRRIASPRFHNPVHRGSLTKHSASSRNFHLLFRKPISFFPVHITRRIEDKNAGEKQSCSSQIAKRHSSRYVCIIPARQLREKGGNEFLKQL